MRERNRAGSILAKLALSTALVFHFSSVGAEPLVGIVDEPCPPTQDERDHPVATAERAKQDWPNLCKYRQSNQSLTHAPEVVFMGDSITENWLAADPSLFSDQVVDRGISGQTTPQMLLRFFDDVIDLHPKVVHILAGTNDVAGNTGPTRMQDYRNSIEAMVELARAHHIRVVLGSIPPAAAFPWRPEVKPVDIIKALNQWLKTYANSNGIRFVDYYSALGDGNGGVKASLSADGVHPNGDGYALMRPLALAAIRK